MSGQPDQLVFQRGQLSPKQLTEAIAKALEEIRGSDTLLDKAAAVDASRADVQNLRVEVVQLEDGFDPTLIDVAIKFVEGMSAAGGAAFFNHVVLPRVKRDRGDDAIGPQKSDDASANER